MADIGPDALGLKLNLVTSAVSGGLVAAITRRGTLMQRIAGGVSGAILSIFMTPVVAPIVETVTEYAVLHLTARSIDIPEASVAGGVGFVLGTLGWEAIALAYAVSARVRARAPGRVDDLMGGPGEGGEGKA